MADHSKKNAPPNDQLRKLQQAADAKKAMSDYHAEAAAIDRNTERLRALRLARDAALMEAAKKTPPKPAAPAKTSKAKHARTAAKLSDWLKDQKGQGRSS